MPRVYDKRSHRNLRARLDPTIQAGHAYCAELICINPHGRWIEPGTPWHLAHHRPTGRYLGPAHAQCNESEAGRHSNHTPPPRPRRWQSRAWGGTPSIATTPPADDPAVVADIPPTSVTTGP